MYRITHALFYIISLLPLPILYIISDLCYPFVYHLLRYRRGIVAKNLATSFPEKNKTELKTIEKKFYHWLCDYFFEAVKLLSISDKELRRRFICTNPEAIEQRFERQQSMGGILGHYCNWEWLSCFDVGKSDKRAVGLIYKPLHNKVFDRVFLDIRHHGTTIPKDEILRYLVRYKHEGVTSLLGYISDQSPKLENIHLWLDFLNHDTGVFTGAERIMRKYNNAVFYVEMSRPKRGFYTYTFHLIADNAAQMPENEITKIFFKRLEQTIRREPAYYLWTHNRWKRTRKEYDEHIAQVTRKHDNHKPEKS